MPAVRRGYLVRVANYIRIRFASEYVVTKSEPRHEDRERACMIAEDGQAYCIDPLEEPLQVIARRWALLVIGVLGNGGGARFGAAKVAIPGISARALASVLRDLQEHGLVSRHVDPTASPPAVHYDLTTKGADLRKALIPLLLWASGSRQSPEGRA